MFQKILNLLYPLRCLFCAELIQQNFLCMSCECSCQELHAPFLAPRLDKVYFYKAYSCLAYQGGLTKAIWKLKYQEELVFVPYFSKLLFGRLPTSNYDLIMPVPLSRKRLKRRGFNQSQVLAKRLAKLSKIHCETRVLLRIKQREVQTNLKATQRLENVKGCFSVYEKKRAKLIGKSILLIDDVITTGATVNECAKVLKQAGAKRVDVLTLARTL